MQSQFEDLTGNQYGHLKVLGAKVLGKKRKSWVCECICGAVVVKGQSQLLGTPSRNPDRSCGCMQLAQKGLSQTEPRLYSAWMSMLHRCNNPKNNNYHKYGTKGIQVCKEWEEDFMMFYEWAKGNGYKSDLTLDRVDSEGNYSPENCRWVDYYVQAVNRGKKSTNKSGHTGISKSQGRYRAYITRKSIHKNLGSYKELSEAVKARARAEQIYKETGSLEGV